MQDVISGLEIWPKADPVLMQDERTRRLVQEYQTLMGRIGGMPDCMPEQWREALIQRLDPNKRSTLLKDSNINPGSIEMCEKPHCTTFGFFTRNGKKSFSISIPNANGDPDGLLKRLARTRRAIEKAVLRMAVFA
jgi:hypothetical protein